MHTESLKSLLLKIAPPILPDALGEALSVPDYQAVSLIWSPSLGAVEDAFVFGRTEDNAIDISAGVTRANDASQMFVIAITVNAPATGIELDGVRSGHLYASRRYSVVLTTPAARAFPQTVDTLRDTFDTAFAELSAKIAAEL
jgi:hypothetical protein